jgi:hypothetical protein
MTPKLSTLVINLQVSTTLFMTGLIWFVQVVHYPLFTEVGPERFAEYHSAHLRTTSAVVVPAMLLEALTAILLVLKAPGAQLKRGFAAGLLILLLIWAVTFFVSVPIHDDLALRYDIVMIDRLVNTNWLRTAGWSVRAVLVVVLSRHCRSQQS